MMKQAGILKIFLQHQFMFPTAFFLRSALVLFGVYQDQTMLVKYTDVDYHVFTDAAEYLTQGVSPYKRATYRYTPLLAWILTPNIYVTELYGKMLFVCCDLLAAYLIHRILVDRGIKDSASLYCAIWLFNPLPMVVSSRGNAESVLAVLVLSVLYYVQKRRLIKGALIYGLSVHMKIYPITYILPIALFFQKEDFYGSQEGKRVVSNLKYIRIFRNLLQRLLSRDILLFVTVSGVTFALLTLFFYYSLLQRPPFLLLPPHCNFCKLQQSMHLSVFSLVSLSATSGDAWAEDVHDQWDMPYNIVVLQPGNMVGSCLLSGI
ncbi:GPI mannosyltransferase 1 isoform X2 [Xenopus tropicalis]|uniref:GPI alpha-1,4-mannosyltransferase I, catalytic subunit n=1 Tax=Xenopus tropicalis TaxID=8364 RepID=A0A8J1JRH3_XENTR|nr:GPI mannosyltransferase 1 isoform X2 [Xenopus tropicalis]